MIGLSKGRDAIEKTVKTEWGAEQGKLTRVPEDDESPRTRARVESEDPD